MYKEYFKLAEYPFSVTANPNFLYWTKFHEEALSFMFYGIEMRKGFVLLTGEVGTGKTTVCRALVESIAGTHRTAFIFNPNLSELELLASIVEDFGIEPKRKTRKGYGDALNRFLIEQNSKGATAVLVIDEAQNLSRRALEQVRLLSNFESTEAKLLQIILAGQPELRKTLEDHRLKQLDQRIGIRYHLNPIGKEDISAYIEHRLGKAGSNGELRFHPSTYEIIYEYSKGVPRLINMLCDKALLAAFARETFTITDEIVIEAQSEIAGIIIERLSR